MASKKIEQTIDVGLWYESDNGYITSVWDSGGWEDGGEYILNVHKSGFPAHHSERHATLEELEKAMRKRQPDLRRWKYRMS